MRSLFFLVAPTLTAVLATFLTCFAAAAATIVILQPRAVEHQNFSKAAENDEEGYINRIGQVVFTAKDLFSPQPVTDLVQNKKAPSLMQSELIMSFFPEQDFRIIVDSESVSESNIFSLGGRLHSAAFSTFSMTVTSNTYLMTLQDVGNGMTYKVVGDMETGIGRATEYDLTKLPPVYDAPPIIPPPE
jgi:hypothetical protein